MNTMDEDKWQEPIKEPISGVDTSDEEKAFSSLSTMKLSELRNMYLKEFGVDTRSKDVNLIAKKIAQSLVSKSTAGSTAGNQPTGITPQEAEAILKEARSIYFDVEQLKEEKKSVLSELREQLKKRRDDMDKAIKDTNGNPVDRVSKMEVIWSEIKRAEDKKNKKSRDYKQRIDDATNKFRNRMTNINQVQLPFK